MKHTLLILIISSLSFAVFAQKKNTTADNGPVAKNIILLIGDGMGVAQLTAGITVSGGHLNIAQFIEIGLSKTQAASDYITDSGAAGTAISTGYKTYSQAIGMDKDTIPRKSILHYAEDHEKATGLVATSQITHATPASFIAHQKDRYMYEAIAADFLKTDIEVFIGGGRDYFDKRRDEQDLTKALYEKGYQLVYDIKELDKIKKGKLAGLLYPVKPPRWSEGRGDMLPISVAKAIELLKQDKEGFFLMIEGSQIDWGGHDNDTKYLLEELLDFDRAVGEALDYAREDGNTLVIVTADHETGGMSLVNGDMAMGNVEVSYSVTDHTGVMVPVFAYGPGSEYFGGIYENTELFTKMMKAFGFKPNLTVQ